MTHSPEQMRKKAHAMAESRHHMEHSNVVNERGGMDHEAHKVMDMREDDKSRDVSMPSNMKRPF